MTESLSPLWHLELLGEMRLTRLDAPDRALITRFRSRKTAALLALLALRRGPHRRDVLAETLWPETDPLKARSSLRVALSSLRTLLEVPGAAPDAILQVSRDSVTLGAALTTDVEAFHLALAAALAISPTIAPAIIPGTTSSAATARREGLELALQWYRGPLSIADEADELAGEAGRLEDEYVDALLEFLALLRTQEREQEALECARRGLERAPLREEIALETLSLSLALGRAEAARDFKRWCARAEKQGVSVAASTLQRARELEISALQNSPERAIVRRADSLQSDSSPSNSPHPDSPTFRSPGAFRPPRAVEPHGALPRPAAPRSASPRSAAPRSASPRSASPLLSPRNESSLHRTNSSAASAGQMVILPPVWTKFFGREAEIIAHAELLRQGTRLLTLTGAGGTGKTALALQIARQLAVFPGGPNLALHGSHFASGAPDFGLIVWVSLSELPVASRISIALAQALGAASTGASPSLAAPIEALRAAQDQHSTGSATRILLILDGFEQLCDDGAPLVRQWLDAMPELTCLLTSRRALGFAGEVRREVLPLEVMTSRREDKVSDSESGGPVGGKFPTNPLPTNQAVPGGADNQFKSGEARSGESDAIRMANGESTNGATNHGEAAIGEVKVGAKALNQVAIDAAGMEMSSIEAKAKTSAAALFIDRAQLARPAWSPAPEERRIVEAISARLEGVPLALEIAAARLALFSPAQILAEIEACADPNRGDATEVTGPLGWKNPDRAAPARQATLRASIAWSERQLPLAAARFWRQISVFRGGFTLDAATQICEVDAAPLVLALVETSLLRLDTRGGSARALPLEIERQYAAGLLNKAETAGLEARHAAYFATWSESQMPGSAALVAEQPNLERAGIWRARDENAKNGRG